MTSEMRASHGEELAKKIQQRLDKFRITPFEDEGENLDICGLSVGNVGNCENVWKIKTKI